MSVSLYETRIETTLANRQPLDHTPNFDQIWAWFCGSTTVTQGSLRAYRQGVEELRRWCREHGIGMRELVPDDLVRFRRELQESDLSASTKNVRLVGIRQFLLWLANEGFGSDRLSEDRIRRYLKGPKVPQHEMPFLISEEIHEFLLAALDSEHGQRDYQLFQIMLNTGLRLAEILNLRLGDIELVAKGQGLLTVRKGKGGSARRFRIPAYVVQPIEDRRSDLRLKWDSREDREQRLFSMSPGNLRKLVRRTAKRVGIRKNVTPHVLRHSFATHFLGPIEHLQMILGHKSLSTTLIYRHAQFLARGTTYELDFWAG